MTERLAAALLVVAVFGFLAFAIMTLQPHDSKVVITITPGTTTTTTSDGWTGQVVPEDLERPPG